MIVYRGLAAGLTNAIRQRTAWNFVVQRARRLIECLAYCHGQGRLARASGKIPNARPGPHAQRAIALPSPALGRFTCRPGRLPLYSWIITLRASGSPIMSIFRNNPGGVPANARPPSSRRDLAVVTALTLGTFVLFSVLELNEWIETLTGPLEAYQLDELPLTVVAMAIGLAWFSWRRTRQVIQMQAELARALEDNRRLSQRSIQVQEEERRALARELHDELGQSLNAIKVDAVTIRDRSEDAAEVQRSAKAIIEVSGKVYDAVRRLTQRLRPVALDELGLRSAVEYGVQQWQRRHPAVACSFAAQGDLDDLSEQINITLYRLAQECLTNVAKHAQATQVGISLEREAGAGGGELVRFSIEDNGGGFDPGLRRRGLGLVGLRERVEALDGKFELHSAPGQGVRIRASIPAKAMP